MYLMAILFVFNIAEPIRTGTVTEDSASLNDKFVFC